MPDHRPMNVILYLLLWGAITTLSMPIRAVFGETIIVSAAASLTQAMQAVGKSYEASQIQVTVTFNFAASGALLQQLSHGAPVDLFISANQAFMDQAEAKELIENSSRCNFIRNSLVLAASLHAVDTVHDLSDLASPAVERIAMGHPDTVPAGRYAREAFMAALLWDAVQPKLVFGNSVRQVLDYLRRGEVDAGLIYATDAYSAGNSIGPTKEVATQTPVVYCLAVIADSSRKKAALQFVDYILGPEGQNVLAGFGFQKIGQKTQ
jgi:molybdate transport system substrate-binding protein